MKLYNLWHVLWTGYYLLLTFICIYILKHAYTNFLWFAGTRNTFIDTHIINILSYSITKTMTTYFYFLFLIVFSYCAKKKEFVCLFPCRSYSHTYTTFGVKTSMFAKPFIIFTNDYTRFHLPSCSFFFSVFCFIRGW